MKTVVFPAVLAFIFAIFLQAEEGLLLSDFEGDLANVWGGPHTELKPETNAAFVKEGRQSGRWEDMGRNNWLSFKKLPADWSGYNTLTFWLYSSAANSQKLSLTIGSEPGSSNAGNYYIHMLLVDWQGWKKVEIAFSRMKPVRRPVGFNRVTGLMLSPTANGASLMPDSLLFLDDMRLEKQAAPAVVEVATAMDSDADLIANPKIMVAGGKSSLVSKGKNGALVYSPDEDGNFLSDFSFAGYKGGGVAIPEVPVALSVSPSGSDDSERLQKAVDDLSEMPVQGNGFRGALLLKKGRYTVTNTIRIKKNGVVIRGEGAGFGGTWIFHKRIPFTNVGPVPMIHFPQPDRGILPTFETLGGLPVGRKVAEIISPLVPAGAKRFSVSDVSGLKKGDQVIVLCRHTDKWIAALHLESYWKKENFVLQFERSVVNVDPSRNEITLDIPLTSRIDTAGGYATGELQLLAEDKRVTDIGMEDILFLSDFDKSKKDKGGFYNDENHPNQAFRFYNVKDGWMRRCVGFFHSAGLVATGNSFHLTIEDCAMLDGVSLDTPVNHAGSRKYYFNLNGAQNLVQRCYGRSGRHTFVGNGPWDGGVFLDCYSEKDHLPCEWHQGWGHGHLYDNVAAPQISIVGVSNYAHGQRAAFSMIWNCFVNNKRDFERDIRVNKVKGLFQNYAVGNVHRGGKGIGLYELEGGHGEEGLIESDNCFVDPRSLYLAQLEDRLGAGALRAVATKEQLSGNRGAVWLELIKRFSALPVYEDPERAPWSGFENWKSSFDVPVK